MNKCYIDGHPCDCGAMDDGGECPLDTYVHDNDGEYDGFGVNPEYEYEARMADQSNRLENTDDCHIRF
jgi:hypothetical protein